MDNAPILGAILTTVAFIWVFVWGRIDADNRTKCICGCLKKRHASQLDYDSDFGNPGRMGAIRDPYIAPGKCRDCRCRSFIEDKR